MLHFFFQIIHLKRFDYVNSKWVKTQKVVNFPFKNFDPTAYLASVPQETILRHRQLLEKRADLENSCESSFDNKIVEENGNDSEEEEQLVDVEENEKRARRKSVGKVRQRLESTSLTKTPINDKDLKDYHQHKLLKGQDPFDLKYQLYAVVSHSGLLNGGHYISYACNPNGNWYCYNDSSCREVATENIDCATQAESNNNFTPRHNHNNRSSQCSGWHTQNFCEYPVV